MRHLTVLPAVATLALVLSLAAVAPVEAAEACTSFNVTTCPQDRCQLDSGSRCNFKPCRQVVLDVCANNFMCQRNGNWCDPKPCATWSGALNLSAQCSGARCSFNQSDTSCKAPNCEQISAVDCPTNYCDTDNATNTCRPHACGWFSPANCSSRPGCVVQNTSAGIFCVDNTTAGQSTPPPQPTPTPTPTQTQNPNWSCKNYNASTCPPGCAPNAAGACLWVNCSSLSLDACEIYNHVYCIVMGGVCTPQPCNNFNGQPDACRYAACAVNSTIGGEQQCVRRECGSFSGNDCPPNRCALMATGNCGELPLPPAPSPNQPPPTNQTGNQTGTPPLTPKPSGNATAPPPSPSASGNADDCASYMEASVCGLHADLCAWSVDRNRCQPKPCNWLTPNTCGANFRCTLQGDLCVEKPCGAFDAASCANVGYCTANPTNGQCRLANCVDFNINVTCRAYLNCRWVAPTPGTSGTGQCADVSCDAYNATTCPGARCWYDRQRSACVKPPCSLLTSAPACSIPGCQWLPDATNCTDVPPPPNQTGTPPPTPKPSGNETMPANQTGTPPLTPKPSGDATTPPPSPSASGNADDCASYMEASVCGRHADLCAWSVDRNRCQPKPCNWLTPNTCGANFRCTLQGDLCVEKPCGAFDAASCANVGYCTANPTNGQCRLANCVDFNINVTCRAYLNCRWVAPTPGTSGTGQCADVSCDAYNATTCPGARCWYDRQKSACVKPPCSLLSTAPACSIPGCQWLPNATACTDVPTDQTTMMPPNPSNNTNPSTPAQTTWMPTPSQQPARCSDHADRASCSEAPPCQWDAAINVCLAPPCNASTTAANCPPDRCTWNSVSRACADIPCSKISTLANCPNDRCLWNATAKGCIDLPCWMIGQAPVCRIDPRCEWKIGMTNTTAANVAGWCQARTVDLPCEQRALSDCTLPQCWVNQRTLKCGQVPCRQYPLSQCPTTRCALNISNSGLCDEPPCRGMDASYCLSSNDRCQWSDAVKTCLPLPCSQLAECDPNRCQRSATGQCVGVECAQMTTAAQCPVASLDCIWWNGVCGTGECQFLNNATTCTGNQKCIWNNATATDATNAAARCLPRSFLGTAPCQSLPAEGLCGQAERGRCIWRVLQATETSPARAFCDANAAQLTACALYTKEGELSCKKQAANSCEWRYGSLCWSTLCAQQTTAAGCIAAKCVVNNRTSTCVDPQNDFRPCNTFAVSECPRGLCQMNDTACFAFPSSGSGGQPTDGTNLPAAFDPVSGLTMDDAARTCLAQTTERNCGLYPCQWSNGACKPPSCDAYVPSNCPASRCRAFRDKCVPKCRGKSPYWCGGSCAAGPTFCAVCPANQVQCYADSSCQLSKLQCPCDVETPLGCPNIAGRCVVNASECDVTCPEDARVRCPQTGTCVTDASFCGCPTGKQLCADGKTCVTDLKECGFQCTGLASFKCNMTGDCSTGADFCPCPEGLVKCPVNQKCYPRIEDCPCGTATNATRCATGRCVAASVGCQAPAPTCPAGSAICEDGTCAANKLLCACPQLAKAQPSVDIQTRVTTFDVTTYFQIASRVNFTVCGVDYSLNVNVRWTVARADTGAAVLIGGRDVAAIGHTLSVAPGTFTAGVLYRITAVAFVNGSTIASSSSNVIMTAVAPTPTVEFVGGADVTVPASGGKIAVKITDRAATSSDVLVYACCGDDTGACTTSCPTVLNNAVTTATSQVVAIPAGVPAGNYTVVAMYKGISVRQILRFAARNVPSIQILMPRLPNSPKITFFAFVTFTGATTAAWYVNGTWAGEGSSLTIAQPATWITVTVKVCDRNDATLCGAGSAPYVPPTKIVGVCTIAAADGTASDAFTALSTLLKISSTWTSTTTALKFNFLMAYNTTGSAGEKPIVLAPFDSELSEFTFKVPMLQSNPASGSVRFAVVARETGSQEVIATAVCSP
jgi:hypothetical protein